MHEFFGAGCSGITVLEKRRYGNNGGWFRLRSQLRDFVRQHWRSQKPTHFLQSALARTSRLSFYLFNIMFFCRVPTYIINGSLEFCPGFVPLFSKKDCKYPRMPSSVLRRGTCL